MEKPTLTVYDDRLHRDQVVLLWQEVFRYDAPHNEPRLVIDKKLSADDGLFFLALIESRVVGSVMAGYDGHRGWIYSLAVLPSFQKRGIGTALMHHVEKQLSKLGCMKVNLQITDDNDAVEHFYLVNGYATEKRISMGKRLPENIKRDN